MTKHQCELKILTTIQVRQAKTLDKLVERQSKNLRRAFLHKSNEIFPPELLYCLQESTNIMYFRSIDPAYNREVRKRGMVTACHCFRQKIAFQQANLGKGEWPCIPICIAYNSITWNYHARKFIISILCLQKTKTEATYWALNKSGTYLVWGYEKRTHNMIPS